MRELKFWLEMSGNMVLIAFGGFLIFQYFMLQDNPLRWIEPNRLILNFEFCMSAFIVVLGIVRLCMDVVPETISGWYVWEIIGDLMTIGVGGFLMWNFYQFYSDGVLWEGSIWMVVEAAFAILIGWERTVDDALKGSRI